MEVELTNGALKRILSGQVVDKPVLQIMGYKKVTGGGDRYRMLISDGLNCYPLAMVATQLKERLVNGEFERYTVVRVDNYTCNALQRDKIIMILLELYVIASANQVGRKIGEPQSITAGEATTSTGQQVANEAPTNMNVNGTASGMGQQLNNRMQPSGANVAKSVDQNNASSASALEFNVHPISSLTPYQNKWTIRARVTAKSTIRTWSNSRGEGKLFSLELVDESGEIRATAFTNECDKFYDMFNINDVYYISKASLKTANKQYSSLKNDYEITFTGETTVVPCSETVSAIPMQSFNFKSISEIQNIEPGQLIDVIGVCKGVGDMQTFTSKSNGKELKKREVQLLDKSNMEVNLSLWDTMAETFDGSDAPILAIKGCRVSDFGGRSLSLLNSSTVIKNPDIHEAHVLRGWYEREGATLVASSVTSKGDRSGIGTNWKTFAQAKAEQLGRERAEFYNCKATVSMVKKENCMYMACPMEGCSKKVMDMHNGRYRCDKCDKEHNEFKWRLLLSVNCADFSDNMWVTAFQESGEIMMGISAQELGNLKETNEDEYLNKIGQINFKTFVFVMRAKMENFNEESRMKTVITSIRPLDFTDYGKKLLKDIKEMEATF